MAKNTLGGYIVSNSDPITLGPFEVQYIPITHSIPEARSLSIKTNIGTMVMKLKDISKSFN